MPELRWIGKEAVVGHHLKVPYHLLRCDRELSAGDPDAGNLLVQGDNLLALKALLPYYAEKVKCIYIDPPYNTGNEKWVYNDNVNSPEMRKWMGEIVDADKLDRHDRWLCMIYPRVQLLRQFLREDGAIFVSIDDTEVAYMRCLLNEVFGWHNFIGNIVWQKKQSPQNDAINLSDMHDHILVYAKRAKKNRKDAQGWQRQLMVRTSDQEKRYANPDSDSRGPWTSVDYTCNKSAEVRPNLYYPIVQPKTGKEIWPSRKAVWRFDKARHERNVAENRVWWGVKGTSGPRLKRFRSGVAKGMVPATWWDKRFAGTNQEARKEIRAIFGREGVDFETPKPVRLIKRILQLATGPDSLVLDSFAGSGTTGHAVLGQNKADGGNRRFILVEMDEGICGDVTAQRVRKAIEGYGKTPGLGGGFRFCKLGIPLFDESGSITGEVRFPDLAAHVFFTETGNPIPARASGKTPLLGVHGGKAVYLLFNGVLGDRRPAGGNVLTHDVAQGLPPHPAGRGARVVYGEACRLSDKSLERYGLAFRQIPFELKVD